MSRTLTGGLAAHIAQPATTLATCWRVERRDGQVFTFTDCDRDLTMAGETYLAQAGYTRTAIANAADGSVDNLDLQGVLDNASITEADLRAGLWDYAQIHVYVVDWSNPNGGSAILRRGWIGEVTMNDTGFFKAELRGMAQVLAQPVGQVYAPECRAQLGDARCGVDLAAHRDSGVVTSPTGRTTFSATLPAAEGHYDDGVVRFTGGANAGVTREVLSWDGSTVTMFQELPYEMAPGDAFDIFHGCNKSATICHNKFGNIENFRGEPFVPGADSLLYRGTPPAASSTTSGGGSKK